MINHRRLRRLLPIALALLVILLVQFILVGSVGAQGPEVDVEVTKWAYWGEGGYLTGMTLYEPYVIAGEELFYEICYYNSAGITATNVTLTDTLPMEVQYLEDTGGGVLGPGNTLVWNLGDVPPWESGCFDVKTRIWPDAVADEWDGTIVVTNTIEATSSITETDPADNFDLESTFVQDLADLSVVKMSKPDTVVQAGELFTYTIFVENWGPSFARQVSIRDEILASTYFTVVQTILDPNRDDDGPYFEPSPQGGQTIEFDLLEPLEPKDIENGGRWVIQIVVMAYETQDINNLVQVFTGMDGTPDPDISNNTAIDFISVLDTSDLKLTKWSDEGWIEPPDGLGELATAGLWIDYTLVVTNNGPSTAENVVIEDNLPAEVEILDVYSSQGSCIAGTPGDPSDPTTCNVGTLAPGASATMWIETRLKEDAGGGWFFPDNGFEEECPVIFNDAWTYSDHFDPDNSNNLASVASDACAFSFLWVEKYGEPDPVIAGEVVNYTIFLWNEGPSTASNVQAFDWLSTGAEHLTLTSSDVEGGPGTCSYDPVLETVICDLGDLEPMPYYGPPNRIITLQFQVDPAATPGLSLTNVLEPWADSPFFSDGDYTETIWIEALADLEVGKTVSDPTPVAGQQVTYHIDVYNNGPSVARDVGITDTLPVSTTYVVDSLGCGPGLDCDLGDMWPGESREFDIIAQVDPNAHCGEILVNEALVSSEWTSDTNPLNNIGRASIQVECEADLKILKFGKPDGEVWAGQELVYTIVVDNLGPGTAHNVVINDLLQSNGEFELVSVASDRPGAVISPTTGIFDQRLELRADLDELEVMTPDQSGRWMMTVVIRANEAQDINNIAYVFSADSDPDPSNNQAIAEHEITDQSDLGVTKTAWGEVQVDGEPGGTVSLVADEVTAGRGLTYTLNVMNYGPSTAYNVMAQDMLPPLVEMTDVDLSQGSYYMTMGGQQLNCALGDIAPSGSVTITINSHVPSDVVSGTVVINGAQVHGDVIDRNNANNFATHETTVNTWADLSISKVKEPALPGQMVHYTIVVSNVGPSDAPNAVVFDDLPSEISGTEWEAKCSGGALFRDECEDPIEGCIVTGAGDINELVDIPVGASITFDVGATRIASCEAVTNTASIVAPVGVPDPYEDNDSSDATNEMECQYWPLIIKEILPE